MALNDNSSGKNPLAGWINTNAVFIIISARGSAGRVFENDADDSAEIQYVLSLYQ